MNDNFSRRDVVRYGAEGIGWYVAIFLVLLVVGWGLVLATMGLRVATAGLMGRANVHIQNQSAPNRIVQQAGFETAFAGVERFKTQLSDARKDLAAWDVSNGAKPDNAIGTLATQRAYLAQVVTGLQQQCNNTVATYNADARKILAKDWRSSDLPRELDSGDYCK